MFVEKKREIDNYFAILKFKEKIDFNIDLKYETKHTEFMNKHLEKLRTYLNEKIAEKKKEWDEQIERAKWKTTVQAYGEMKCKNGHELGEVVCACLDCNEPVYWADSDERYVICKKCENNGLRQISRVIKCTVPGCYADCLCSFKWIKGYKP